jgi:hypothetical protein
MKKSVFGMICIIGLAVCAVMKTSASPAVGVTPTLLARGTYPSFDVESNNEFFKFEASASLPHRHSESSHGRSYRRSDKPTIDMVVRTHDYAIGSSTGWHTHPGPVFITVTEGKVTFYEADDPNCTPKVISAGEGYVDSGNGHIGRNESGQPAKDVSVIVAPPGLPFRGELPAPGRYCAF